MLLATDLIWRSNGSIWELLSTKGDSEPIAAIERMPGDMLVLKLATGQIVYPNTYRYDALPMAKIVLEAAALNGLKH